MPSRIYSRETRSQLLIKRQRTNDMQKAVRISKYPTKTLKAFRDNGYVGKDGLDREQYKEEIDCEYYDRMNRAMELDSKTWDKAWDEYQSHLDSIPPVFPFTWDEATQSYIEF